MCFYADEKTTFDLGPKHPKVLSVWKVVIRQGEELVTPWMHSKVDSNSMLISDRTEKNITKGDIEEGAVSKGIHCMTSLLGAKTFAWSFAQICQHDLNLKIEVYRALGKKDDFCCFGKDTFRCSNPPCNPFVSSVIYTKVQLESKPYWSISPKKALKNSPPKWLKKALAALSSKP